MSKLSIKIWDFLAEVPGVASGIKNRIFKKNYNKNRFILPFTSGVLKGSLKTFRPFGKIVQPAIVKLTYLYTNKIKKCIDQTGA